MITRAIVEKVIDEYSAKVRIPIYDKIKSSSFATSSEDLPIARICATPGVTFALRPNDIVYVGFEDASKGTPVILGILSRQNSNSSSTISTESLKVNVDCELPSDMKSSQILYPLSQGDMSKSVYDPENKQTDIFKYAEEKGLPEVSVEDEGKFLRVNEEGYWSAEFIDGWAGGEY